MVLNIITPCSRPQNLQKIAESINIPRENYRWIVVHDSETIPDSPDNCEAYAVKVDGSQSGHGQRNYALDLIKEGHVYFNDDDTLIHPDLWDNIKDLDADFIHFRQDDKNGLRLLGINVEVGSIDSHNFIVKSDIIGQDRWILNRYDANGYFAKAMYNKAKTKKYIPKVLSFYNLLRPSE
ncbi:MAG: glycosyltransferase family A protein [Bacteroidota bacterium]|jgi:hypothetical protein